MKKSKLIKKYALLLSAAAWMFTSCSSDEMTDGFNTNYKILKIEVNTSLWGKDNNDSPSTRASYGSLSEDDGYKVFPTKMTNGDAIGIYAVDEEGIVKIENVKYTYDGSTWSSDSPITNTENYEGYTYYAYYPYREDMLNAPSEGETVGKNINDIEFFKNTIGYWTVNPDQSTLEGFSGSDLMTGKGAVSMPLFQELYVNFKLSHRMGLLVTKPELKYYNEDNPSDKWTVVQSFDYNKPFSIGDELYFIAKPGQETTLGSRTTTVGSEEVEQLYFPNGEASSR